MEEEQVAEVFVRINSEGVTLNQADFILTLMSVFWEKGRRELEEFSRGCKVPTLSAPRRSTGTSSRRRPSCCGCRSRWHFAVPCSSRCTRCCAARTSRPAGPTGAARRAIRDPADAHEEVLDLTNWHEFLQCLERAGFRGSKMISSDNALLFSYALWLIGRVDYGVPLDRLREVIARWFFMAHTTGRYTGAFESRFEQDAARLADLSPATPMASSESCPKSSTTP